MKIDNIFISDLITHKLASPVHALKFYVDEEDINGDDLRLPVEILETILNKSRTIYKFIKLYNKSWDLFFLYIIDCSFFFSPTGEKLIEIERSAYLRDNLPQFEDLNQIFLRVLESAKARDAKVNITYSKEENLFSIKFSREIKFKYDLDRTKFLSTKGNNCEQISELVIYKNKIME